LELLSSSQLSYLEDIAEHLLSRQTQLHESLWASPVAARRTCSAEELLGQDVQALAGSLAAILD
jgi:hypothetical protein